MALLGSVNAERRHVATGQALLTNLQLRELFARRRDGMKGASGTAIVNDSEKFRRQSEHLPEPIKRDLLQLGRRRAGLPEHTVDVESRAQQFAQNARPAP